jgi:hypothetical protein
MIDIGRSRFNVDYTLDWPYKQSGVRFATFYSALINVRFLISDGQGPKTE